MPLIVAINKCDKPDADPEKVRVELLQHEVVVEKLGGDVQDVEVSAVTGKGIDDLLEAIALQAEILELKANPDRPAEGAVIEAKLDVPAVARWPPCSSSAEPCAAAMSSSSANSGARCAP
ncbi:MAG: hypothetical protein KatS3mg118_0510 [Paracoccaceae bacterium]|nr:MAG: hypothetical protein KatS3mg118_0510 [Paracoccaceae bacterium]